MEQNSNSPSGMNRRKVGAGYESIAGAFLEKNGYRILAYNFRNKQGEIDIVARDGKTLVFVEVKYRSTGRAGDPLEAVDLRKQSVICRCADFYRIRYGYREDVPCRFDVVGILGDEIRLVKNAFDYIPPSSSRRRGR